MSSSPVNNNLGGRPATGVGTLIGVRLRPDQLAQLDAWIADQQPPTVGRPEAIRRLIEIGLERQPTIQPER